MNKQKNVCPNCGATSHQRQYKKPGLLRCMVCTTQYDSDGKIVRKIVKRRRIRR